MTAGANEGAASPDSVQGRTPQERYLRDLGALAAGVAHDFNNVLAAILGRVELLLAALPEHGESAAPRAHLRELRQAALDGAALVRRLQRGTYSGATGSVDVPQLLRDVAEFTRPRWRDEAEREGRAIFVEVDAESPLLAQTDAAALREVLVNLVFNAIDAMPNGGTITLHATIVGDRLEMAVADTGVGIPEADLERVFAPFYTTKPQGNGLGLTTCRALVEALGGGLTVESAPGAGTIFSVRLPLAEPEAAEPAEASPAISPRVLLIVEAEPAVRAVLQALLEGDGHRVTVARDAAAALDLLAGKPRAFDAVLIDLGMPEQNGLQLVRALRAMGDATPCLIVTGWHGAETEARAAGAEGVVLKPFTRDALRAALAALDRAAAAGESGEAPNTER
jgi:CheY-like chemotaxis protein/anti-sigma regulatory factor (Ser/Thr protein kinase)